MKPVFDMDETTDSAWCPGCGNFGIHNALKQSLEQLQLKPEQVVLVSGIGQAAKLPHYVKSHVFNGLHGRYLSSATAIKAVNPGLTVIAVSGDGCTYGEGGNHFIHTIRRNPDITNIVHNNLVYGLTKGQASPTSLMGFKTPVQIQGVMSEPFNPLSVAIALDASFVARAFAGDIEQMKTIFTKAIKHRGYALSMSCSPASRSTRSIRTSGSKNILITLSHRTIRTTDQGHLNGRSKKSAWVLGFSILMKKGWCSRTRLRCTGSTRLPYPSAQ